MSRSNLLVHRASWIQGYFRLQILRNICDAWGSAYTADRITAIQGYTHQVLSQLATCTDHTDLNISLKFHKLSFRPSLQNLRRYSFPSGVVLLQKFSINNDPTSVSAAILANPQGSKKNPSVMSQTVTNRMTWASSYSLTKPFRFSLSFFSERIQTFLFTSSPQARFRRSPGITVGLGKSRQWSILLLLFPNHARFLLLLCLCTLPLRWL